MAESTHFKACSTTSSLRWLYCFDWLRTTPSRSSTRTVPTQHCRRLASLAAKLVKQLTYILYNMCDSTGSGATHLPATIASLSAHPQRILITLLVVQVIEIEWLVSRLQRWEQLPFAGVMMCSMPCVGVKSLMLVRHTQLFALCVCLHCVLSRSVWPAVRLLRAGASQAQNHAQNCTYTLQLKLYSMYMRQQSSFHMRCLIPGHAARGDV